jgi:hypothetical protein
MKASFRLLFLVVVFLLVRQSAFAQAAATGDLRVSVRDPKGNAVVNATVTARNAAKGLERAGSSDGQGGYSVRQLAPDTYTVTVEASGFARTEATGVDITVGGMAELPVTLTIASGKEIIEVSSEAVNVETSRSSTTDTVGERRIDNLPINGRNYIQFTLTDSQVQRDSAPNLGAAPTSGLNMSGQRGRSNLVNVDGADATDNSTNGVRSTVSQEAVQEFQIITNNYASEYGRAAGGVVNIITRSGSNDFHGDVYGYLRNRNFQAVNPFSTTSNPAYTRVQGGVAFGGPIKKDTTYYYFAYETTRRHETGFSSIGQGGFGLVPFNTATDIGSVGLGGPGNFPLPFGTIQVSPDQQAYLEGVTPADLGLYGVALPGYVALLGASSGQAVQGYWPADLVKGMTGGALSSWAGFPTTCLPGSACAPVPTSYQTLTQVAQEGNFPVFEGTSLYSLRIDHNVSANNRLTLRVNASPSTVKGIEASGQDQPFGQNSYSRTSEQTYRDVAGVVQDTWTLGNSKVNEFRFQYARRGLAYFYNTQIPAGSYPAVNIPGFAYFGREPYSYIQRTEKRYQFTDNFSWSIGRHDTKFGGDFNYLPINATFTVNYGGVYDFANVHARDLGLPAAFPDLSPVQAYGAGVPGDFIQGFGSPSDSFSNKPLGLFWQDSWRVNHKLTLNYGVRYDVEFPPTFKPPTGLAQTGYNFLGLQKGIQTDKNNIQPRIGIAWDPKGDGKTVVRASFGMFYDHPLLGLYFLGDASDGSTSGQLAFGPGAACQGAGNPGNLNAVAIFQGLPINVPSASNPCAVSTNSAVTTALGYLPNQQQFQAQNFPQSIFLNQNYLSASTPLALGFQPFGYPQGKNFVYAYAQQANFSIEKDLGGGFALNLAYNFNGGRHLNRPINANTIRGDLMVANFNAALAAGKTPSSPFTVSGCGVTGAGVPYVDSSLMNFFRPSGLNPSIAAYYLSPAVPGGAACVGLAQQLLQGLASQHFNTNCDPTTFVGCIPFGDMDANFSNGSSVYHGLTANLRKRFRSHYEFLASYTWSHAIDDSTDLQSTLTPQDSYFPSADRSTSLFDQRQRFVFSGVYQTGKLSGSGFASKLFSNWTFAPLVEFGSGRPFNLITGDDNLQLSSLTGRPNTTVDPFCGKVYKSKYSPTGTLQEPCINGFVLTQTNPTLAQLDGNLGRNAGITPWTVFNDMRVAKKVYFGERFNMDLMVDMFNIANRYNVAAVSPFFQNAGQATAAYDPRQFQFALKLNW